MPPYDYVFMYLLHFRWNMLTVIGSIPDSIWQLVETTVSMARERHGDNVVSVIKSCLPLGSFVVCILLVALVLRNKTRDLDRGGGNGDVRFLTWTIIVLIATVASIVALVVMRQALILDEDTWDSGGLVCDLKGFGLKDKQLSDDAIASLKKTMGVEPGLTMHLPALPVESPWEQDAANLVTGSDADDDDTSELNGHTVDVYCDKSELCGSSDQIGEGVWLMVQTKEIWACLRRLTTRPIGVPNWARHIDVFAVPFFTVYEVVRALLYLVLVPLWARLQAPTLFQESSYVDEGPVISLDEERRRAVRRPGSHNIGGRRGQTARPTGECNLDLPCSYRLDNAIIGRCGQTTRSTMDGAPDLPYCSSRLVVASTSPNNAEPIGAVGGTRPRDDNETQEAEVARTKEETARLEEENDKLRRQLNCLLCTTKLRTILFSPCSHMVCCEDCAHRVDTCPVCRADIARRWLVYLPDG